MSNNVAFTGRLGRDPELNTVGDYKVLNLAVANNTGFGDKKVTNWFNCAMWGARGEKIAQYLSKGSEVFITGELTLRKYTDKEGVEKMSPDVRIEQLDFCGSKADSTGGGDSSASTPVNDEDLPF